MLKIVKSWELLMNVKPWEFHVLRNVNHGKLLKFVKSCMLKNPNEC